MEVWQTVDSLTCCHAESLTAVIKRSVISSLTSLVYWKSRVHHPQFFGVSEVNQSIKSVLLLQPLLKTYSIPLRAPESGCTERAVTVRVSLFLLSSNLQFFMDEV